MRITDLPADRPDWIDETARILFDAMRPRSAAWPTIDTARREVVASLEPGKISRIALDDGAVVGWVGGQPHYDGNVWELHPMAVAPAHHGRRIGTALVRDLETQVARRGALTLYLGSDDEQDETSLAGADLYADLPSALKGVRNLRRHPYEFYQRLGFSIVGVIPDANGRGRPDILMAKRVAPIEIRREPLDAPVSLALIGRLNAELSATYPEEGANHFQLDLEEVAPGRGAFVVLYRDEQPAGCGAVRRLDTSTAELKRMFVASDQRGAGLGRALLETLEAEARALGASRLVLETGTRQTQALALYEAAGFRPIPLYGEYLSSPQTSLCLGKDLA